MTSSTITTHNSNEVSNPIENLGQATQVNGGSTSKAINSSEANLERESEAVATSSEGIDTSRKYDNEAGESDNSTRSAGHVDSNTSLPPPENITTVSIEKDELDDGGVEEEEEKEKGKEESEDCSEDDSEDDFPVFEGGEPRGRVVNPVAGRPVRPIRPR